MFGQVTAEWAHPEDPRYKTRPPLLASILKLMPKLMLQELVPVQMGNDQMGYQ